MARRGPKSKYDPEKHPRYLHWMLRAGLTIEQIVKEPEFNISKKTLYAWAKKHPEIGNAIKGEGKKWIDYLVEDSLLKRAHGFEYTEEKVIVKIDKDGKKQPARVEHIKKYVVPDVGAIAFWLKNRKPAEWRESKDKFDETQDWEKIGKEVARALDEADSVAGADTADN